MPTLPAFSAEERDRAHRLLAIRVAHMMGRKLEEADWTDVYCAAKGIEPRGWSNLDIDVIHENLGVEHKMLRTRDIPIEVACGTTPMHPSLTRSFRISSSDAADVAMRSVFEQYAELVEARRQLIQSQSSSADPVDLRIGWLLWQDSLREFLYFEEPMAAPHPDDYFAEWHTSGREGSRRKTSKNLWIYEKSTQKKRYSVTTDAGAKIQPYFDVPPPSDPNLYIFKVIGERLQPAGGVRVWLSGRTVADLTRLLGELNAAELEAAILQAADEIAQLPAVEAASSSDGGHELILSEEAYDALTASLPGVNDDHRFQLLIDYLQSTRGF